MLVAFIQEFAIDDRSTSTYDFVKERLDDAPHEGLIATRRDSTTTTACSGILDVWESRDQAERFLEDVMAIVGSGDLPVDATPPSREEYYELHDLVKP